jgi:thiamine pyrophosphate-dependent acetolactate synthase large subunit-like protein
VPAAIESMLRAHQIASTQPYGPTYVCLDVALQEEELKTEIKFPDVTRFAPGLPPAPAPEAVEEAAGWLVKAKKPVILMGRVSRNMDDWHARIALAEAQRMNLSLPGLALAHQLYTAVKAQGNGRLGTHALALALEKLNNVDVLKK